MQVWAGKLVEKRGGNIVTKCDGGDREIIPVVAYHMETSSGQAQGDRRRIMDSEGKKAVSKGHGNVPRMR